MWRNSRDMPSSPRDPCTPITYVLSLITLDKLLYYLYNVIRICYKISVILYKHTKILLHFNTILNTKQWDLTLIDFLCNSNFLFTLSQLCHCQLRCYQMMTRLPVFQEENIIEWEKCYWILTQLLTVLFETLASHWLTVHKLV